MLFLQHFASAPYYRVRNHHVNTIFCICDTPLILLGNRNNGTFSSVPTRKKEPTTELGRRLDAAIDRESRRLGRILTQQELAKRSGVSQSFISQLRTGERGGLSGVLLRKLEAALPGLRLVDDTGAESPMGVEEFLASDLAKDITDDERRLLEQAAWVLPPSKVASKGDWYAFLRWVRSLPDSSKERP